MKSQNILLTIWLFALFPFIALPGVAKDFGVAGHQFEIIEQDFMEVIFAKTKSFDLSKFNKKIQDQTKKYVERPTPVEAIRKANENKEFFYEPIYVLEKYIRDHQNNLIHGAGTKVNTLEYFPLREALIFIDGDDESQVKLALNLHKKLDEKLKIILVKGEPLKLQRNEKKWIYFDQAGFMTSKLGISEVPALVTQDNLRLKINIMAENL